MSVVANAIADTITSPSMVHGSFKIVSRSPSQTSSSWRLHSAQSMPTVSVVTASELPTARYTQVARPLQSVLSQKASAFESLTSRQTWTSGQFRQQHSATPQPVRQSSVNRDQPVRQSSVNIVPEPVRQSSVNSVPAVAAGASSVPTNYPASGASSVPLATVVCHATVCSTAAPASPPLAHMAMAGIDTNHDGRPNFVYVGADTCGDGIPDALQDGSQFKVLREVSKTMSDPESEVALLSLRLTERDMLVEDLRRELAEVRGRLAELEAQAQLDEVRWLPKPAPTPLSHPPLLKQSSRPKMAEVVCSSNASSQCGTSSASLRTQPLLQSSISGDQPARQSSVNSVPAVASGASVVCKAEAMQDLLNDRGSGNEEQTQEPSELVMLMQIIEDQRRETQLLRTKVAEQVVTNTDLGARVAELEQIRVSDSTPALPAEVENQEELEPDAEAEVSVHSVNRPAFKVHIPKDIVDQRLQEYLLSRPDFALEIAKIKPGWYIFGEPVCKKLYLKVVGEHVVCRVGGGHKDLFKFLDDHRFTDHKIEVEMQAMRARSRRKAREAGVPVRQSSN